MRKMGKLTNSGRSNVKEEATKKEFENRIAKDAKVNLKTFKKCIGSRKPAKELVGPLVDHVVKGTLRVDKAIEEKLNKLVFY